ncbi:MAG: hypothetical protein ACI9KE_004774 [Polyangiales bacterium]|jgi:hypothetical protein
MTRLMPVFLLCAIACGDDSRPAIDGGPITRVDSGTLDTGDTFSCEDPYANLVTISEANPSEMILPRCATATAQCAVDCPDGDNDCFDACLLNDPTTPFVDGTTMLNCDDCFTLQSLACLDNFCGLQFADLRCCLEANDCDAADCPACTTDFAAFATCRDGDNVMCGDFIGPCFPN